ncbi:hypothetical protein ACQYAD_08485 [Neobacillus sp. SM06]|uniref:hypothetical protein n=1 Tax=Neobacillus sp. SM06 TaxID=3422492 RepID=UPI003D2B76E9
MYNKQALALGRLYDDTLALKEYNKKILELIRSEYYKKHIDFYGYERFINLLQVMNLHLDEMKIKMDSIVEANTFPGMRIDVKA